MWHLLLILIGSEVAISQQYWGNFNPYYQRGFVPAPAKYFGHFPVDDEPIYQNSRFVGPQLRSQPIVYPSFPQFDQGYQQAQQPPSAIPPSTFQSYPNPPVIANPTYQPAIPAYQPSVVQPPVQPSYPNPPVIPNPTYQPPSPAYQPSVAPPPVQPSYQPSVPSYPSPSYPSPTPSSYSGNSATFNAASPLCSPQYNYGSGPVGGGYGGSQSQWGTNSGSEPVIYQGSAYFPVLPTVDLSRCFTRYTETRVKGLAPYLEATAGNVEECLVTCLASWVSYQQMCQSVVYLARTRSCQLFNATARWKPAVAYMQYGCDNNINSFKL